jgi:hypothetical protein
LRFWVALFLGCIAVVVVDYGAGVEKFWSWFLWMMI